MDSLLNVLITIGPIALLGALISAVAYYIAYHFAPEPKKNASVVRYVLMVFAAGGSAFVAGAAIGISVFCSSDKAGNLCGLGGVFGLGPLLSGAAIFLYARFWASGGRLRRASRISNVAKERE
jgi:hypothetical protein